MINCRFGPRLPSAAVQEQLMATVKGHVARSDSSGLRLPREVMLLSWREREIARIVYRLQAATAEDVCFNLEAIRNGAVRSMLNRLVAKGILKRTFGGKAYVYLPDLSCANSAEQALKQFAEDYFGGSVEDAAETVARLLGAR
jgi:predicted transcriptional regulator